MAGMECLSAIRNPNFALKAFASIRAILFKPSAWNFRSPFVHLARVSGSNFLAFPLFAINYDHPSCFSSSLLILAGSIPFTPAKIHGEYMAFSRSPCAFRPFSLSSSDTRNELLVPVRPAGHRGPADCSGLQLPFQSNSGPPPVSFPPSGR